MGYGKNLKNILKDKGMSVKELSRRTDINSSTLYTIIRRDSAIRYDCALRIANVLDANINLLCNENPYREDEIKPDLLYEMNGLLSKSNIKSYIINRSMPLFYLFDYKEMRYVDKLISEFYELDSEGREFIFDVLESLRKRHIDPERSKNLVAIRKG